MRGDRRNNNKGFTLVEAVVSMLILAVVILSIIGGFNIITEANFKAKKIQGANTLYSNISEKLRDATGYDEMDNLTKDLSKDFNVGAMKYTAEVSIEGTGEQYKDSNGKVPIDEDAVVTVIKYKVSDTETKNVEVKCDKDGNFYFYPYVEEITGAWWSPTVNYVQSTTKSYLTWYNSNSDYYYYNSIYRRTYWAGINEELEIPLVTNIVKSYDNYVYQLNSEDYAKFPVFDSSTKSFLMNYNDLDEINNVYDGEGRNDITEIDEQSTYSVSNGGPSSKLKGIVNSGDKGRVNTKFIAYKFKKRWYNEIENGKNVTYVEYLIATMVTYNKGVDQYVSPNYYGYDYV
nr:prepilin-type N-terminal cleavage/methylation domain-containing protein [Lachnospiraceae bacterium]